MARKKQNKPQVVRAGRSPPRPDVNLPRWPTIQWMTRALLVYVTGALVCGLLFLFVTAAIMSPSSTFVAVEAALAFVAGIAALIGKASLQFAEHAIYQETLDTASRVDQRHDHRGASERPQEPSEQQPKPEDQPKRKAQHAETDHLSELFGDVEEAYRSQLAAHGRSYARTWLWIQLLRTLPFIVWLMLRNFFGPFANLGQRRAEH